VRPGLAGLSDSGRPPEMNQAARHEAGRPVGGDSLRWRFMSQAVLFIGAELDSLEA
jgi:hypothetical protein